VILENYPLPLKSSGKNNQENQDDQKDSNNLDEALLSDRDYFEDFFLKNIDKIPTETILVFVSKTPDKRKSIFKKIKEVAQIKEYILENEEATVDFFSKRFL
jgi:hypothetical protein